MNCFSFLFSSRLIEAVNFFVICWRRAHNSVERASVKVLARYLCFTLDFVLPVSGLLCKRGSALFACRRRILELCEWHVGNQSQSCKEDEPQPFYKAQGFVDSVRLEECVSALPPLVTLASAACFATSLSLCGGGRSGISSSNRRPYYVSHNGKNGVANCEFLCVFAFLVVSCLALLLVFFFLFGSFLVVGTWPVGG